MVNSKYEVDEKYWLVDGNDKLTSDQKEKEIQSLDEKGRKYKIKTYALSSAALLCFLVSTGLLIKRKNIIKQ